MRTHAWFFASVAALGAAACGGGSGSSGATASGGGGGAPAETTADFDLSADLTQDFWAMPWPSDLRLTAGGAPDVTGFPNPKSKPAVEQVRAIVKERKGFPVIPVGYFHFSGALQRLDDEAVIPADASSPILLVDVDPKSPERGTLYPTVATTPPVDDYVPEHLLAVAPRPGVVLAPRRTYAFVVRRALGDAAGKPLGVPTALADLAAGKAPAGPGGAAAKALYDDLFTTPSMKGVDVAAATVFTTGDVVADLAAMGDAVLAAHAVAIQGLHVDPDGGDHDRFCELVGTVKYPQFQVGKPPFDEGGTFALDEKGVPVQQRLETAPIVVALPKGTMPAGGYPLDVYFHGSGGLSTQVVDRGAVTVPGGDPTPGQGPSYVLAPFGIATAGSALPLNPERFPGASETEYLNLNNLAAFRDTFRQGDLEQRLFIAALKDLEIDPATVSSCAGLALAPGEAKYHFAAGELLAQGQSMGGMYANLISATEPRIRATLPTGAGGFWTYFILKTSLIPNAAGAVGTLLLGTTQKLTFMHPALMLTETAWEPADPVVFMPRLARRPLPGHPVRPIYEPVGKGDSYFPTQVYDAMALAYGHREAGKKVWGSMQEALALEGLDGFVAYPLANDVATIDGAAKKYTGVVVQYEGDGIYDPHAIFAQLDSVKYQYGCFFDSFLKTGTATVPAPAPLGTPCPGE